MSLDLLTSADAVRRAIAEFDEIGRDAFLAKYGFGTARDHFVRDNGRLYDSKAIAGAAVGYEHPDRGPLRPSEFHGGGPVRAKLGELGFTVVSADEGLRAPATWWVNQGTTYDREHAGGYIWAPQT